MMDIPSQARKREPVLISPTLYRAFMLLSESERAQIERAFGPILVTQPNAASRRVHLTLVAAR